jgi:hypothetical protein
MNSASFPILLASAIACWAADEPDLTRIRTMAETLLKRPDLGGNAAFCEYAPITQVHGCSGPGRNEFRHVARPDGTIETWMYRSLGESGDPIGRYRGRLKQGEWRALLGTLSRMGRGTSSASHPLPPPGPLETIPCLTLSDGKHPASYCLAGHPPESIESAFDRLDILAQAETDTVWDLSLTVEKAQVRKDSVVVTAGWKWRGPAGARILFSDSAGGTFCGKARFKWFADTSAFTVDWHPSEIPSVRLGNPSWNLQPGLTPPFHLVFPYTGTPKSRRTGQIDGIGIRLVVPGEKDTISATVFSKRFLF